MVSFTLQIPAGLEQSFASKATVLLDTNSSFKIPAGEFPEEDIESLVARGHPVDKVKVVSLVHGARRTNSFIIGLKDPRSVDAAGATIS